MLEKTEKSIIKVTNQPKSIYDDKMLKWNTPWLVDLRRRVEQSIVLLIRLTNGMYYVDVVATPEEYYGPYSGGQSIVHKTLNFSFLLVSP